MYTSKIGIISLDLNAFSLILAWIQLFIKNKIKNIIITPNSMLLFLCQWCVKIYVWTYVTFLSFLINLCVFSSNLVLFVFTFVIIKIESTFNQTSNHSYPLTSVSSLAWWSYDNSGRLSGGLSGRFSGRFLNIIILKISST